MLSRIKAGLQSLRSLVYDSLITRMTTQWYRHVLIEIPPGSVVLDVGIGTATSLLANRDIVLSKGLRVVGVDYDAAYIATARRNIEDSTASERVRVVQCSIHDYAGDDEKFDVVYFSGSFMIIPRQADALRHCVALLRSRAPQGGAAGNIFFTQTFENESFFLMSRVIAPLMKRLLRLLTSIDFGQVTYETDFRAVLAAAQVRIVETRTLKSSLFRRQTLVIAQPMED